MRIIFKDKKGKEADMYFSDIGGEKYTFKQSDTGLEEQGHDTWKYDKYFDIPEEDRKYLLAGLKS